MRHRSPSLIKTACRALDTLDPTHQGGRAHWCWIISSEKAVKREAEGEQDSRDDLGGEVFRYWDENQPEQDYHQNGKAIRSQLDDLRTGHAYPLSISCERRRLLRAPEAHNPWRRWWSWGEAADAGSEKPSPQFASETAGYDLAWRDDKTLALSGLRLPALSLGAAAGAATLPVVDRAW